MQLQVIFGTNVRNLRKEKHYTQEKLAELVDVSMETIGKIERGSSAPTFATAERIAAALDVPVTVLFGANREDVAEGARTKLLGRIDRLLVRMNDDQLSRVARIIEAFLGV